MPWIQNSCGKTEILKIYCCKAIFKKNQGSWLFVSYLTLSVSNKIRWACAHRLRYCGRKGFHIKKTVNIFGIWQNVFNRAWNGEDGEHGEKLFFSGCDFLTKPHWKNPHHVWAHAEGDGAEMPLALDTVLIRTFLRVPFRMLPLLCCSPSLWLFFFFHCKRSWIEGLSWWSVQCSKGAD